MATRHGTLDEATARTVSVPGESDSIAILHKGNVPDLMYVRADGQAAATAASGTFTVLPGSRRTIPSKRGVEGTSVSLISDGAVDYEIEV